MMSFIVLLVIMQVKHWYVDFVLQTDEMVKGKGIYGNIDGIEHSFQHALASLVIFGLAEPTFAFLMAIIDFVTHYHIDYVKMKYGCRDITQKAFWVQLGLDQMAHQLVYIGMIIYFILH